MEGTHNLVFVFEVSVLTALELVQVEAVAFITGGEGVSDKFHVVWKLICSCIGLVECRSHLGVEASTGVALCFDLEAASLHACFH